MLVLRSIGEWGKILPHLSIYHRVMSDLQNSGRIFFAP